MKKKIICLVSLFSLLIFSCSKDQMVYNEKIISPDILKLKNEMNLVETNAVAKPLKFNSVEDARAFLLKMKKSNGKISKKVKFDFVEDTNLKPNPSGQKQQYTMHFSTYNIPRLKSSISEDYITNFDAGLFSSFYCNFSTDSNNNINSRSVNVYVTGAPIGWSWDQVGYASSQGNNTFLVTGTVTWGIDFGGIILGWIDGWTLSLQFDMENKIATWTVVRFY